MFDLADADAATEAALAADDLVLIPTHTVQCATDGVAVALTEGPFGRCSCEVLTVWILSRECEHICLDCQGDLEWSLPWPVLGI